MDAYKILAMIQYLLITWNKKLHRYVLLEFRLRGKELCQTKDLFVQRKERFIIYRIERQTCTLTTLFTTIVIQLEFYCVSRPRNQTSNDDDESSSSSSIEFSINHLPMNMLANSGSFTSGGSSLAANIDSNLTLMFSYRVVTIPSDTLLVVITFVVPDMNSVEVIAM